MLFKVCLTEVEKYDPFSIIEFWTQNGLWWRFVQNNTVSFPVKKMNLFYLEILTSIIRYFSGQLRGPVRLCNIGLWLHCYASAFHSNNNNANALLCLIPVCDLHITFTLKAMLVKLGFRAYILHKKGIGLSFVQQEQETIMSIRSE